MSSQPQPLSLSQVRDALPPANFRSRLRKYLIDHPNLTLNQVASIIGVSRQRVSFLVGPLGRPNCARPGPRQAPKLEQAQRQLKQLEARVRSGESASAAVAELGISLSQAARAGFRVKSVRPSHGMPERAAGGDAWAPCGCWRCRRAAGIARPRGRRADGCMRAEILDWLAWCDPDTGEKLSQMRVGELSGVGQSAVSRVARAAETGR